MLYLRRGIWQKKPRRYQSMRITILIELFIVDAIRRKVATDRQTSFQWNHYISDQAIPPSRWTRRDSTLVPPVRAKSVYGRIHVTTVVGLSWNLESSSSSFTPYRRFSMSNFFQTVFLACVDVRRRFDG